MFVTTVARAVQSVGAKPDAKRLKHCDAAMASLLRSRRHDPAAQRILQEGYLGRWPLSFLAAPAGLGASCWKLLRGPRYPSQYVRPKFWLPFLSSRPVWPSSDAVSKLLVSNWEEIREEFKTAIAEQASADINTKSLTQRGHWQKVPFYSQGLAHEDNLRRCPKTAEVLAQLPLCRALGMAYFSEISPGSDVKAHFGPTNARIRYHLGLDVPEGNLYLAVGDGAYKWGEGEVLAFDDAYIHAVKHEADRPRGVLIVDIYHPELTPEERQLLEDLEAVHRGFFPVEYEKVVPH